MVIIGGDGSGVILQDMLTTVMLYPLQPSKPQCHHLTKMIRIHWHTYMYNHTYTYMYFKKTCVCVRVRVYMQRMF